MFQDTANIQQKRVHHVINLVHRKLSVVSRAPLNITLITGSDLATVSNASRASFIYFRVFHKLFCACVSSSDASDAGYCILEWRKDSLDYRVMLSIKIYSIKSTANAASNSVWNREMFIRSLKE